MKKCTFLSSCFLILKSWVVVDVVGVLSLPSIGNDLDRFGQLNEHEHVEEDGRGIVLLMTGA